MPIARTQATAAVQVFVLRDGQLVANEVFGKGVYRLGSDSACHLVLDDADVSPHHASIELADGEVKLTDQGSPLGTFVNGRAVDHAVLTSADDIHVGPYLLKLRPLVPKKVRRRPPPAAAPARAPSAEGTPLRVGDEAVIDDLLNALGGGGSPPAAPAAGDAKSPDEEADECEWTEVEESENDAVDVDLTRSVPPPAPPSNPPVPGMVPAPVVWEVTEQTPPPPVMTPTLPPRSMRQDTGTDPRESDECLRVKVSWGRQPILVQSFKRGQIVTAAADERAALPLYGLAPKPTTLAVPTATGWTVQVPAGVKVSIPDASGRSQPLTLTAGGVALALNLPVRLSTGNLNVDFVRQVPPGLPIVAGRPVDPVFITILATLAALAAIFIRFAP